MKRVRFIAIAAAALLIMQGAAKAHHGFSAFDTTTTATFKGTVTDFHFVNPHCIIEFDVKDDKGEVQNWKAEMTSPIHLVHKGWSESTVQAGDVVTITGYRAKNGARSLWTTKIILGNGQESKIDTAN
jgi:hypothetical protein